jgi:hypothetical protein
MKLTLFSTLIKVKLGAIVMKNLMYVFVLCLVSFCAFAENTIPTNSSSPAEITKSAKNHVKKSAEETTVAIPEVIRVGMYLNDVQNIDVHNNNYLLDFFLWFKWNNKESDPTASFEFLNHSESWGTIITKVTEKPEELADGTQYQVLHIQGRMSNKMDLRAYPFDKQYLTTIFEDGAKDVSSLIYQIDEVSVNPALKIPGFEYREPKFNSSTYTYPTRFGDTRTTAAGSYSRVTFKLPIHRNALTSFVKNILPIWLAVICGSFALMLHPRLIESRFQIAIFSILSLVSLQISNGNDLPSLQYMNLMDALYVTGYIYLICLMGALIIATKWVENEHEADNEKAKKLDKIYGFISTCLFFIANMVLIFFTFTQN